MRILIAEDELPLALSLQKHFADNGLESLIAIDGEMALDFFFSSQFNLVLLDWKMPKLAGLEVCKRIRKIDPEIPILLLTAINNTKNKVEALNAGADDYITKPFSFEEVLARIHATLRRSKINNEILEFNEISLDLNKRKVITKDNKDIHLSDKEFDLFKYLIKNKGQIINKDILCHDVWELNFVPNTNICEATVKNLRKKIEEITGKKYIKNVYGEGYILLDE